MGAATRLGTGSNCAVEDALRLPEPCLVILVGPGASGKSSWAEAHFPPDVVLSSDRLRAMLGAGEDDVTASADAFELLEEVLRRRLRRRLTTVVDTLGLDRERRLGWLALARQHGLPCIAVAFDTPAAECRERNRGRAKRIPADVLAGQFRTWAATRELLPAEGYDLVITRQPVRTVAPVFASAAESVRRQQETPTNLRFGLQISRYTFSGGTAATRVRLREIAAAAEQAGFDAIYVMDHFRQIPQAGRAWEDFLESWTTLAYLAACTDRVRLGTLVSGVTYRNVAHLGKIVATLDVLSGGRTICGLGLAWFKEEHEAFGWDFPPTDERYALLEDALQLLPLLWGPGGPPFEGRVLHLRSTASYPRPLQEHVPVVVGGGGERRTLGLAARYADAANVMGDLATVRRKAAVLRQHCQEPGREVQLTHLSTALVAANQSQLGELLERHRPRRFSAAQYAAAVHAGTVEDHIGRCRDLAEAGVREVMLSLPNLDEPDALEPLARLIATFR